MSGMGLRWWRSGESTGLGLSFLAVGLECVRLALSLPPAYP